MNSEFSITSHTASIETARHSRQSADSRGTVNASNPQNRKPWSRWVKLYGSNRCWELSELQGSPDHTRKYSQEHHHRRPWLRSRNAVPTRTTAMANQGKTLFIPPRRIRGRHRRRQVPTQM